ncbi:MAG: hypothetical protein ABJA50_02660, partial [Chloroflexota bacterium]
WAKTPMRTSSGFASTFPGVAAPAGNAQPGTGLNRILLIGGRVKPEGGIAPAFVRPGGRGHGPGRICGRDPGAGRRCLALTTAGAQ